MMDYRKHPAYAMYSSRPPPPPPRATTTNTTAPESRLAAPPPPSPASSSRAYAPLPEAYALQSAEFPRRDAEVPRSTLTTAATNSLYRYPPAPPPYPPENRDASGRAENARRYHVTQTGRGSVKKPPHHHPEGERRGRRAPDGAERRWGYREGCLPMNPPSSHDHARRRSLGSTGASSAFPGPPDPSVVGSRRMPPPSPPQHYPSRSQSGNAAASFLSREPPSAGAAAHHRPGSSMSISAMLGSSDADRPARDGGSSSLFSRLPASSAPFGSAPPPSTAGAMSPPTAPARPSAMDYSPFRRSHTPEKSFSKPPTVKPYRSNSGGIPAPPGSESSRFGGLSRVNPSTQHPEKASSAHPSPQVSSVEPPYSEPRRLSFGAPAPRPNSQPQHVDATGRSPGYGSLTRPSAAPVSGEGPFGGRAASYMGHEGHQSRFGGLYGDRHLEEQAHRERERALAQENEAKASQGSARFGSHYGERESSSSRPPGGWEMGRSQPASPEAKRFSAPESTGGFGFGAIQSYTKSLGSQLGGARGPMSIQPRQDQPTPPPHETPSYLSKLQTDSRMYSSAPSSGSSLAHATEEQRRKGSEELLQHRNLLGVGLDAKRGGRASPLPQAVQGAQAQILGPAEAGIKSDLGRVFSGIGSGVGGVTAGSAGSGPSTPMAASPFKRDSVTARSTNSEPTTDETKIGRPTSATGKRSRKSRDEDYAETEASARGGRRSRHLHHHHHQYVAAPAIGHAVEVPTNYVSHHHHRHKDEDVIAPHRPPSTSVFPRTTTPAEGSGVSGHPHHHHHHHHHHPHHHHHHAPRPSAPSAVAPMREPRTVVTIEPTLASVAHLPRHHLGSTLYSPIIGVPTEKASLESAKFGYTTTPRPLPRFEGKANCTFTVRVPRFRIDASHREEICARRALWGSGIYTDDSDPVAAAIHSGFLRGAWPEDVEVDMLDLEIRDAYQHAPKTAADMGLPADETRPGAPPVPPTDKDLHITLLVLPALERYDSSVLFGIKSRMWDRHHDGMSFKVQRVEWVEEGVGRGEERGGAARRKRLRNLMQSGRICTGPGVVKLDHLRNGIPIPRQTPKTESSTMQTVS